jgi:hypothetical protein
MYFDDEVGMSVEVPFLGRERSGYRVEEDSIMPIVYTFR